MHMPNKQLGMAGMGILAALMVVAVVTAIAVKQSWRNELDMLRSGHRWAGMQAESYMRGAEQLSLLALNKDQQESKIDSRTELWASGFEFPTDHGAMRINIVDAQSRINLNALGQAYNKSNNGNQPLQGWQKYSEAQRRFIRFVQTLPLDDEGSVLELASAEALLEAIKDWIDSDSTVSGFGGAEQSYYENLDIPVTIANGPMTSSSELLRIKGMSPMLYRQLRPYVTVLDAQVALNVNTMPQPLARSFGEQGNLYPLSEEDAARLYSGLSAGEPEKVGDILELVEVQELFPNTGNNTASGSNSSGGSNSVNQQQNIFNIDGLAIASGWFELQTTVTVGDHTRSVRVLVDRTGNKARIVRRSDTPF